MLPNLVILLAATTAGLLATASSGQDARLQGQLRQLFPQAAIKILVGLDPLWVLTGIIVAEHTEPYGNFSIDLPRFPAQFRGKSIKDPFRVGGDIHAVSRATMTVSSAARAVRNSARRVARQLITPPESTRTRQ